MKITDFGISNSQEKRLERVRRAKTKSEKRELEEKLLVPEELPPYTLESSKSNSSVADKTVTLVFGDINDVTLLAKYFKISEYKGKNIRSSNLKMFITFLKLLDSGKLTYNKEHDFFKWNDDLKSKYKNRTERTRREK